MAESNTIHSIDALLDLPAVKQAGSIELIASDAIHFRLLNPDFVFELVECRLLQRDPETFKGFARVRKEVERSMGSVSTKEKIDACCLRQYQWGDFHQVLMSAELEVWMDLSYPNPWALDLYHQALALHKSLSVTHEGPFSKLFNRLILQKNGFEQLAERKPEAKPVRIVLGAPYSKGQNTINFFPEIPDQRPHPLADGASLSEQLANGVIIKDREDQVFKSADPKARYVHDLGYRLLGPTLVLLFQHLRQFKDPVGFTGVGSGFLTTVGQSLLHPWPWLPEITSSNKATNCLSLLPNSASERSLMPDSPEAASIIPFSACDPTHLLIPPMQAFFLAAMKGPQAPRLQASAFAFIRHYARTTRGLFLPLPISTVVQQWAQQTLSPKSDLIRVISREGILPGFSRHSVPWQFSRMLKTGPWPSGQYALQRGLARCWAQLMVPERCRGIEKWYQTYEQKEVD